MNLGFTGTQRGLFVDQMVVVREFIRAAAPTRFHHGDCIGADAEAHRIVRQVAPKCKIIIYPPVIFTKRAFCQGDESWVPDEYLARNRAIVTASDVLLATPGERTEQLRSGTWSTVRFARKCGVRVVLVFPSGETETA